MVTSPALLLLLRKLAEERLALGQAPDAIILLEHLARLQPDDQDLLENLIGLHQEAGDYPAALTWLLALKTASAQPDEIIRGHVDTISTAVISFKAEAESGNNTLAERLITPLTELLPDNSMIISAALQFHHGLEQHDRSVPLAHRMLQLEPNQSDALLVLIDECRRRQDGPGEVALRLAKMDHNRDAVGVHQAHNIYELVNVTMCLPLTPADLDHVERAQEVLRNIARPNADEDKGDAWTRFYQAMVGAIHIPALRSPPPPLPRPLPSLYDASGHPIQFTDIANRALRFQAEASFLVAGDEGYVLRYAGLSCLIVVHVIGGEGRMAEIAAKIGIDDDRLVLSSDDFKAGDIASLVYDAPSQKQTTKPIGHYQSIRFHHAGMLLYGLKIPLFMTDIDLMLERGVRDLLIDHGDKDMVLNENRAVVQFASRLTANLLLLFPTDATQRFSLFLSNYLDLVLQRDELPKFVDQIAMLVARHFVQRTYPDVKIAYFDVNSDINNCVFTQYGEHPFRFLSLYQKFDLTTLPVY
jgi:tetratricopeptide (TPR) repeat protein